MLTSGTQMRFYVLSTLVNNGYNTMDDDKTWAVCVCWCVEVIRQMDPKNNPSLASTAPELLILKTQLNEKEKQIQQLEVIRWNWLSE